MLLYYNSILFLILPSKISHPTSNKYHYPISMICILNKFSSFLYSVSLHATGIRRGILTKQKKGDCSIRKNDTYIPGFTAVIVTNGGVLFSINSFSDFPCQLMFISSKYYSFLYEHFSSLLICLHFSLMYISIRQALFFLNSLSCQLGKIR